MRILVCDDEKEIVQAIRIYMEMDGHEVLEAGNGREALRLLDENEVHLMLLDIMMPEMDGVQTLMQLRKSSNIPVIMLSAKSEDTDKILGLNLGADDYITKPFNHLELSARVKSALRRYTVLGSAVSATEVYCSGQLVLDDDRKEVTVDGEPVHLTPVEYKILRFLIKDAGRVYSIDQIYQNVWNEPVYNAENIVPVHIRRIREKIEINPKEPKYLKVVWGIGYKVEKI